MIGIATKFAPKLLAFETAQQAGFRRAELWTDAHILLRHAEVAALAKAYPFDYAIHFPNRLDQPPEVLEGAVALYRELDARALIMHQPHQDRYGQTLAELHPGIRLAVENHRLTPEEFNHWAERNPGLTLDVEHLWMLTMPGEPLANVLEAVRGFLERFGDKLHHVHMPGYWPGTGEHRPMYCSRELVRAVWDMLEQRQFTGLIVSEVNPEFQNIHDLMMDVLMFEKWKLGHKIA